MNKVCDKCFTRYFVVTIGSCTQSDCNGTLRASALLSAAPKMLAALKDILGFLKRSGYDVRIVNEAIRAAEEKS